MFKVITEPTLASSASSTFVRTDSPLLKAIGPRKGKILEDLFTVAHRRDRLAPMNRRKELTIHISPFLTSYLVYLKYQFNLRVRS